MRERERERERERRDEMRRERRDPFTRGESVGFERLAFWQREFYLFFRTTTEVFRKEKPTYHHCVRLTAIKAEVCLSPRV